MNPAENSSSSLEKFRVLAGAMAYQKAPDLVVALGTAGSKEGVEINGSVVIGRRIFIHDPKSNAPNRNGLWTPPHADVLVESSFPPPSMLKLDEQGRHSAEARFLRTPVNPTDPMVYIGNGFVSVGVVNITNYDDYAWADRAAVASFNRLGAAGQIGSIETTHGVICEASQAPFIFVSGISDTEGLFDYEVTPRVYSQNFVAAHNAGVALSWLLPSIVSSLPR